MLHVNATKQGVSEKTHVCDQVKHETQPVLQVVYMQRGQQS